ncbi:ATP-dependent helicase HrpA [Aliivibrio fischeri MJ11]|uniref:ATP-dependent helicase HrpA n=1 Tax=Aliivibrio fischeri (strain MJ11) TaxID=388396 RepID=B5FEY4_ALIFM|nr:DEAD/DEAH box helicase [Aliivibrio fischeri]ACH65827.1 ATP-dependent helicase HrpA [Aliivibrio fischeri MJ11]
MSLLPINTLYDEFSSLVNHKNLVVESETGSGKSTHLPMWAAEHGRVLVVEPRRIACTALADYLSTQRGQTVGDDIGYAIKLDAQYTDKSKVIFVTPGIALKWFMEDRLVDFSFIIIDEFHERRWDSDLLLSLLKLHQQHHLILTSATMDSTSLAQYIDADVLKSKGRQYPVTHRYISTHSQDMPSNKDLDVRILNILMDLSAQNEHGDVLIFLPGKKEIQQCIQAVRSKFQDVLILPLYAGVSDDIRQQVLSTSDQQRFVFSTNVAETSLTIPNITVVIDSGLERRTHQRNGRTTLSLQAISKASVSQRSGRAGRTQAGTAIHMYGEFAPLERTTPPELQREELVEPMLAAASCGSILRNLPFLEVLPTKSLSNAELKLQAMKALNGQCEITDYGRRLFPLPIDTLFSHMLSVIIGRAEKETIVDLVSALSVSNKLYSISKNQDALEEFTRWNPKGCDLITLISIVRGHSCEGVIVDKELQSEARKLSIQIRYELGLPDLEVSSRIKREEVLLQLVEKLPELVFVRREKRKEAFGNGKQEVVLGRNSCFPTSYEAALVFDQFSLPGRGSKQTLTIATALAPIDLSLILNSGLAECRTGEVVNQDGEFKIMHEYFYANRKLKTEFAAPENTDNIAVIVNQVCSGLLMPQLKETREKEIAAWKLYCQLNNKTCSPISFEIWFKEQLESLGVTSVDEMELFDETDFVFHGIPEWELQDFLDTYPQKVVLPDIVLSVEYFPLSKRILLHYHKGQRKGDVKRWELPSWAGWKLQYKKASRTVDIK